MTLAISCALAVSSLAGMDGKKSVVLVVRLDVEVVDPGTFIEPRDGFLGWKAFKFLKRFISLMIKVREFPIT